MPKLIKYLRVDQNYFKIINDLGGGDKVVGATSGHTLTTDRAIVLPYRLWQRLWWVAKSVWYKRCWERTPEDERMEFDTHA